MDLVRRIDDAAVAAGLKWELAREGRRHSVYKLDGLMIPIPRHNEIEEFLIKQIFKECEPKLGRDWWRK